MLHELKNAQISQAVLNNVLEGMSPRDAFDSVLGVGSYEKMASELYDELKLKEA